VRPEAALRFGHKSQFVPKPTRNQPNRARINDLQNLTFAGVAPSALVLILTHTREVAGSNPAAPITRKPRYGGVFAWRSGRWRSPVRLRGSAYGSATRARRGDRPARPVGDLLRVADRLADLARRDAELLGHLLRDSPSRAITATRKATSTLASARSRSGTYSSRSDGYTSANGSSTGADIRCSNAWKAIATAPLLDSTGCGSDAGADRCAADARISSL
jgi:hypothetical protein